MLKIKDLKIIYYSAGNQCYQRKVIPEISVVNRLISVREFELRAVAIKHLVKLSVEHELFVTFLLRENLCHVT